MNNDAVIYENITTMPSALYCLKKYQITDYQGDIVAAHFHFMYELMWFDHSQGYFGILDRQYPIKNGTLVFIPAMMTHALTLNAEHQHQRFLLQFESDLPAELAVTGFSQHRHQIRVIYPDEMTCRQLNALFDWADTLSHKAGSHPLLLKTMGLLMELAFSLHNKTETLTYVPASRFSSRLHQLLTDIEQNSRWSVTTRQASGFCLVSESYFSRTFKQLFSMTFKEYVFYRKLKSAIRLLIFSRMTVAEIAEASGFTDSAYFCLRFRQYLGCTPVQFRKQQQNLPLR